MTCCRQWWTVIVKNIKFEQVSPHQGRIEDLGLVYHIIACTALLDTMGQVSSKVSYNGPVFVAVSRYDKLGPYLSLNYVFPGVLALSVMFDHITIKEPRKRESDQKWSIAIQNVLS